MRDLVSWGLSVGRFYRCAQGEAMLNVAEVLGRYR